MPQTIGILAGTAQRRRMGRLAEALRKATLLSYDTAMEIVVGVLMVMVVISFTLVLLQ